MGEILLERYEGIFPGHVGGRNTSNIFIHAATPNAAFSYPDTTAMEYCIGLTDSRSNVAPRLR